jgi:hypothetical protein
MSFNKTTKKPVMEEADFDEILAKGTKVLKLSTFNENSIKTNLEEAGSPEISKMVHEVENHYYSSPVVKRRDSLDSLLDDNPKKSDTQLLIDFLNEGPPPHILQQQELMAKKNSKKGLFGWGKDKKSTSEPALNQPPKVFCFLYIASVKE